MDPRGCRSAVAETTYTPFRTEPDAAPARLIVRRVQPTPGSQWANASPTGTEKPWNWTDHRRHAEIENADERCASLDQQVVATKTGLTRRRAAYLAPIFGSPMLATIASPAISGLTAARLPLTRHPAN